MNARAAIVTVLGASCFLLLLSTPFEAATAKKAKRKPAPAKPAVSAAAKSAALSRVESDLETSAGTVLAQPGALVPLFELLYRSAPERDGAPVHILHFGDSHTAADEWTGGLRDAFKHRFGDGGAGFALAGHPFLGYRRFDLRGGGTTLWHPEGLRSGSGDGWFGLGGVSIATDRSGQSVFIDTECDRLEIHYLQQPGGGGFAVLDNEQRLDAVSTDGELAPGIVRYDVSPGPHRFQIRTLNARPVRVFGWVADKKAGVTYEALGINGAEAALMLRWNPEMLAAYLQSRNPGLIVLSYGTNEASNPTWGEENYQAMFSSLLQRLRAAVPGASILVLGPADRWARYKNVGWKTVPGIDRIIDAQKAACRENRCAFWDARERMGGKGSMRDWVYAGQAQPDYVHFTSAGYQRLAAALFDDISRQYETYLKSRLE